MKRKQRGIVFVIPGLMMLALSGITFMSGYSLSESAHQPQRVAQEQPVRVADKK